MTQAVELIYHTGWAAGFGWGFGASMLLFVAFPAIYHFLADNI